MTTREEFTMSQFANKEDMLNAMKANLKEWQERAVDLEYLSMNRLHEIERLELENKTLREALKDCVYDFEEASQYKGEYLSTKHRDAEVIAGYRKLLLP